jgi:hypothetical protein
MDWTGNLLTALYFAAEHERDIDNDGAVWAIVWFPDEDNDLNVSIGKSTLLKDADYVRAKDFKFAIKGVKIIYPYDNNDRLIAQQGLFTIQEDPWTALI